MHSVHGNLTWYPNMNKWRPLSTDCSWGMKPLSIDHNIVVEDAFEIEGDTVKGSRPFVLAMHGRKWKAGIESTSKEQISFQWEHALLLTWTRRISKPSYVVVIQIVLSCISQGLLTISTSLVEVLAEGSQPCNSTAFLMRSFLHDLGSLWPQWLHRIGTQSVYLWSHSQ